jgi:hypothetical protein
MKTAAKKPGTARSRRPAAKPAAAAPAPAEGPDACPLIEHVIRERAYEIFRERGSTPGQELDDWLRAERELRSDCKG